MGSCCYNNYNNGYNNGQYNNGYNNGYYNNGQYNNGNYNNGFSSGFTNGGGCQCDNRLSSATSMGTRTELVEGRTTLEERGATQPVGGTLAVEICKPRKGFQTTRGLTGPVDITDDLPCLKWESIKKRINRK